MSVISCPGRAPCPFNTFERLRRVNAREAGRVELEVREREPNPLALSDENGLITISKGAVELCLRVRHRGPHLLAFVLGHELAHLESRDSVHLRFLNHLMDASSSEQVRGEILELAKPVQAELKAKELEADRRALQLLTLAGFDPNTVVHDALDFLQAWSGRSLGQISYGPHPSPSTRVQALKAELTSLLQELDDFYVGNRLFQAGFFDEAASLYERFLRRGLRDPAALNNAGLAYLQAAAAELAHCDGRLAMRFQLPTILDSRTLAERAILRGEVSECYDHPGFFRLRTTSERLFEEVVANYPDYVPGRFNWVSLNALSNFPEGVLVRLKDMPEMLDSEQLFRKELWEAIGRYLWAGGVSGEAKEELATLRQVATRRPLRSEALYNLGSLLWESGEHEEATEVWKKFLELESAGVFADNVRNLLELEPASLSPADPPPPTPLGPLEATTREWLIELSNPVRIVAPPYEFDMYRNERYFALVRDGVLLLVEEKLSGEESQEWLQDGWTGSVLQTAAGQTRVLHRIAIDQSGDVVSIIHSYR